jgi:SnoaL-like domain
MTAGDAARTDGVELPEVVTRYQDAHDRHDTAAALSAFASNARVLDDGHEYNGSNEIRDWLDHAASEYTFTPSRLLWTSDPLVFATFLLTAGARRPVP